MTRRIIKPPSVGRIFRPSGSSSQAFRRGPRVLLLLHDDCARCQAWARQELHRAEDAIAGWGGGVVWLGSEFRANHPGAAWVAVVDEWEEVFHVTHIDSHHRFPDPADLVEWVRFVAIQCPECEGPEGSWRH